MEKILSWILWFVEDVVQLNRWDEGQRWIKPEGMLILLNLHSAPWNQSIRCGTFEKRCGCAYNTRPPVMFGPHLGVWCKCIYPHPGLCRWLFIQRRWDSDTPFFSPQITGGQNAQKDGCLDRAEAAGFKAVWHPEAATSWSSSQQANYYQTVRSTGVLRSDLIILFIKQTAVFLTSKNFLVTFMMNLFVTKLCISRSASGRQRHVVLPRRIWKKSVPAFF